MENCDHIIGESSGSDESWLTTVSRLKWDQGYLDTKFNFCPTCGVDLGVVWESLNATTKESDPQ